MRSRERLQHVARFTNVLATGSGMNDLQTGLDAPLRETIRAPNALLGSVVRCAKLVGILFSTLKLNNTFRAGLPRTEWGAPFRPSFHQLGFANIKHLRSFTVEDVVFI